ncbi:laccase-1-like [Aricia agestis]|uniref:laccase-1-like n=1 Tax=Aricia agestis TaxID=91739 RepID=UPI001C2098F0|nr:laccase-1-like [Aricia agestis]
MKTILISIIIVININSNSKASLDSFLPTNNVLVDTTKNYDKSCHRPCKFNVKPRKCNYDFVIGPTVDGDGRASISINGQSPGPAIHVCLHDTVVVRVKNKLTQDVAIHWHGIEQKGTPYHDGVPMVTQCPITYGSTYQYAFVASSPGTYFYHADSVSQQSDGLFGSLIVDQPRPQEPHSSLYNFDNSDQNTILISAKFPELLTDRLTDKNTIRPEGIALNGESGNYKAYVIPANAYMFRLINAIGIECPVTVSVQEHGLTVIATDGRPVKPVSTRAVKLYPGERMDVVVRADQSTGGYWIRVAGENGCSGLDTYGMLLYSGYNYTIMFEEGPAHNLIIDDAVAGQDLHSLKDTTSPPEIRSYYLGIDRNYPQYKDSDVDFSYRSDAMPKSPFIPAAMTIQEGVVQINGKNFLYPNVPLLLKPQEVLPESSCLVGEEADHKDPQCVQTINAKANETIELILVNEGFGSNDSYTFHMHGYSMQVLTTWQSPAGMALSKEEFMKLDTEGKITRNVLNPPNKDTIHVPNKGFVIVRIKTDVGGSWLLECRSCGLSALPVAVLINVQQTIPKLVVDSLPPCSGYKPADVLLN